MHFSIVTVFPQLYSSFLDTTLIARAQKEGLLSISVDRLADFVPSKERIDAPVCGPTPGMVLRPDVVQEAVSKQEKERGSAFKIFFSPHGKRLDQESLADIYRKVVLRDYNHVMLIAGRYEGMDARVEDEYADEIISIGNFVLMGGDLPAMLFMEAFLRLIPKVVGRAESVENDSFSGPFVDHPEYSLPVEWKGRRVPEIIRSGNHGAIKAWRRQQAILRSLDHHFEWVRRADLSRQDVAGLTSAIPAHYAVLMHGDVLVGKDKLPGATSVTSIDVHDIARSARTYGLKGFFIVTPLLDQQKIVKEFLQFWQKDGGISYNHNRHEAIMLVQVCNTIDEVVAEVKKQEGKDALLVATSAQADLQHQGLISLDDQGTVWKQKRPVLLVFGTGQGLTKEFVSRSDFMLLPLKGLSDYNHLSVRSAAAIIFDRWLGIYLKKRLLSLAECDK